MKRFWTKVDVGNRQVLLDGKPVRTPARAALTLPSEALADAVADEWRAVGEELDPRAMPLTGLANAAIDRVAADPASFAAGLAKYAESDLLCYRAEEPDDLVERQMREWDPLLAWARTRYDVAFAVTSGIVHVPQPPATVARLGQAVASLDPFTLAGLQPLVTIGGSLIVALAVLDGATSGDEGFAATHLDELWQAEQWGEDPWGLDAREARRRDWDAGVRLLALL